VLFLALVAVAVAAAIFLLRPRGEAPAVSASRPAARFTQAPAWTPAARARAVAELRESLAPAVNGSTRHSLVVLDAQGRELFDDCAGCTVIPASVQKLIVADVALHLLGPQARLRTILAARSGIGTDGSLDGDLWLVGSGDPSLRSSDLATAAATLQAQGLRTISGGVVVDATSMRGPEINPYWDPNDAGEDFQTATSAVSLDGDTAEFRVYGGSPGAPARVVVVPNGGDVHLTGSITTGSADDVVIAPMPARNTFRLDGSIPPGAEEKFWLPVHGIVRYAGAALDAALRGRGIVLARGPSAGTAPLEAVVVWDHQSLPLRTLIAHMLVHSDNHYAEQLLRILGGEAGAQSDDGGGLAAELQYLRSRSIPAAGLRLVDGSGLAEANRVSAIVLARLLSDAELNGDGYALYPLLPAGGRDGTLKHYDFTTAYGRVRAKTGHLSDAASLAGYLDTHRYGRITFAFLINDSPGDPDSAYVRALDRLAEF
jgi:D-alanyl-D-alanine carboxypeptidase/D-alanyl-D-alanine-endopeptidase (penicillin-binding protein 4)